MKTMTHFVGLALLSTAIACPQDAQDRGDEGTSGAEDSSSGDASSGTVPTTTAPTTTASTSATTASTTDGTDVTDTGMDTSTGEELYDFEDGGPEEYTQIDRVGMPIAAALVTAKDEYNAATPLVDVTAEFVPEIVESVTALHAGLDDDLGELALTPCGVDTCMGQLTPYVIPDVVRIELADGSGFPNGRRLEDSGMDIMLAVMLLDLEVHDETTLLELPLNPTTNDLPLSSEFPYLADPH